MVRGTWKLLLEMCRKEGEMEAGWEVVKSSSRNAKRLHSPTVRAKPGTLQVRFRVVTSLPSSLPSRQC
jgi:hypothetical protein